MALLVLDTPILKIEGLTAKFDVVPVSASLALLLGSELEAKIVQQLHFWTNNENSGVLINGAKWIYKTFREWIGEVLPSYTTWQLRKAIASLIEKGVIEKEHLFAEHWGNNYHPKNRTCYYRLLYEGLESMASKMLETIEKDRFAEIHKTDLRESTKQVCDYSQNNTENTSTENNQKKQTAKQIAAASTQNKALERPIIKKRTDTPESELNPVPGQNKHESEAKKKVIPKDKKVPLVEQKVNKRKVEQKINNKQWKSHIDELDKLGVPINKTVVNMVKLHSTKQVQGAIALFKARKREQHIANPSGYFVQALKENWAGKTAIATDSSKEETVDTQAVFRYWYDLARELGYCMGQEVRDGEQWVCLSGTWEKWSEAVNRGYTLEYLKGVLHRQKNP